MSRRRIAGFGHRGGTGMTNAELKARLPFLAEGVKRHDTATPNVDLAGDANEEVNVQVLGTSDGPVLYISVCDVDADDLADCTISGPRITALAAFLKEHFPNV